MMRCVAAASAVWWVAGWATGAAMGQQYEPGDQVVVVAKAGLQVSGDTEVDEVGPGLVAEIEAVNGKWLWLANGMRGWLDQKHAIPLNRAAIDRLTAMIRRNPKDAGLYSGRAAVWKHLGEIDTAIADYSEAIRIKSSASAYNSRARAWDAKGEYEKAIVDYNEAIRLDPKNAAAFNNRGTAWSGLGEFDKAIADYNEASRLDPKNTSVYISRGMAWEIKREYGKALADYNALQSLDPVSGHNAAAWVLATCPDAASRNGKQAVINATKACELTDWKNAGYLDTLAAAYAEAGDFEKAVEWQTKVLHLAGEQGSDAYRARLELYKSGKPYHE